MPFFQTIHKLIFNYGNFFVEGVRNTLILSVFSVAIGTVLGAFLALARMSRVRPLRWLATAYIEFFRGTPLMVQLMFIFYGLPMVGVTFPEVSIIPDFSRFMAGIIAMSLNSAAYVAEVIRSGIQAVDPGQMEAGRALGLSFSVTMGKVVIPQAVKNILPTLGNEFITLIKETSIVNFIGATDLCVAFRYIGTNNYEFMVPYLVMAVIYIVLVLLITWGIRTMERRMKRSDRV